MRSQFRRCVTRCALFSLIVLAAVLDSTAAPITYPNDGTAQLVNVIRRYKDGLPTFTLGGGTPTEVFDGGFSWFQWNGITTPAGTVLQVTLDQAYSLRRFQADFSGPWLPGGGYNIGVSTTGFGLLTTVASSASTPSASQVDTLGSAVNAKYIQYTFFGPSAGPGAPNAVIFKEFQAFADASAGLQSYNSTGSFNVAALQGSAPITLSKLTPSTWQGDAVQNVADRNIETYLRGNGTGDAQFLMNLGSVYKVDSIGLGFYIGQPWGNGIKIEGSKDNVNWTTLYDVNTSVYSSSINVPNTSAQYLRVTDKNGSTSALTEFEVYAAPMPTLAATPLSNSTINMGMAINGSDTTLADAIQLQNVGEAGSQLTINSFNITGPDGSKFTVPDFAVTTLTVGGIDSILFDVKFTAPNSSGSYSALLEFVTSEGSVFYNLVATSAVPEPSTFALLGLGLVGFGVRRRRIKNQ